MMGQTQQLCMPMELGPLEGNDIKYTAELIFKSV